MLHTLRADNKLSKALSRRAVMMLGVSFGVAALSLQGRARSVSSPAIAPSIRAVFLGQSEIEYLFRADSTYQKISYGVPPTVPNLVVITQNGPGVAPVRTEVTAATIAAGHVNPAMAALSEFLAYAVPGRLFVIGDLAVQGTGRESLFNDSNTGRLWSDLTSVVDLIEGEFGPVQHMIECWYNADRTSISSFRNSFWPMYFGANGDGTEFELGTEGGTGTVVDQCIWDASALPDEKGRGVFARATTKWHILTPMPFASEVPNDSEMVSFSAGVGSLGESDRARLHALEDDSLAQSVNLRVGPSAHVTDFGGGIHPDVNSPDGQALFTWPFAVSLLRAAGNTVGEPRILDCEAPTDGTYADLIIDLPNGGELTTLRQFRGQAHPVNPSPHQQQVTGIEIARGAVIRPVFHTAETSYPTEFRGTVAIQDSGSGNPRRGRVRITPEQPFVSGDSLSYLRGRATGLLQKPRDVANKV